MLMAMHPTAVLGPCAAIIGVPMLAANAIRKTREVLTHNNPTKRKAALVVCVFSAAALYVLLVYSVTVSQWMVRSHSRFSLSLCLVLSTLHPHPPRQSHISSGHTALRRFGMGYLLFVVLTGI